MMLAPHRPQGLVAPWAQSRYLSELAVNQSDTWRMIRRRAAAAVIIAPIGCHTLRATGITAYLLNGCAREHAQEMAAHESPRTTQAL
jgi:integrase